MTDQFRDLEHRFNVTGRDYVLQVCGCGKHPAPVTAGPADVVLFECVPEELLDHEDDSPDKVVSDVIAHAKKFMPDAITPEQWDEFAVAVDDWVCQHRVVAALASHDD